jgi:integrase
VDSARAFAARPDVPVFFGSDAQYRERIEKTTSHLHVLQVVLYHRGQTVQSPCRFAPRHRRTVGLKPDMEAVSARYVQTRALTDRPSSVAHFDRALQRFIAWTAVAYPQIQQWDQVTREQVLAFIAALNRAVAPRTGRPYMVQTKIGLLSCLGQFFRDTAQWGWDDVPGRPLIHAGDLPKLPLRVPRYIPDDELARLMAAIGRLECPYQRAALLIARWSGARRDEIRRLAVDCLDRYPDGTSRLHMPAGKTKQERMVPLNEEAADAIRTIQTDRAGRGERGLRDELTGHPTRYLFMQYGKLLSPWYLFQRPLAAACQVAGLVTPQGKPTVTAHRFRHTVGTQLAERGATLHTIMSVLGHTSASMALVYAQISDQEVLKQYQAVLGPGAVIAGPYADALRSGTLPTSSVEWLRSNFFKTELELGHCLRLPQEGPCECDLYLACAKFVTTPEYAPRLRQRRLRELELIDDAASRGWLREIERHRCTVSRIEQLLTDLGEPIEQRA